MKNKKNKNNKRKTKKNKEITKDNSHSVLNNINNNKKRNQNLTTNNNKKMDSKKEKTYNDTEMNELKYDIAKKEDSRAYLQYYLSLLRSKHILFFSFCQRSDYNSQFIKIYIFFYTFAINYIVRAMFYSDDTMHGIYVAQGKFDYTYQLPQKFYTYILTTILKALLSYFGLYEKNIIAFKNNKNKELSTKKVLLRIKCKLICFFIITYILLFFFWIYLGCFCAVYKNTQIYLLLDILQSFSNSFTTPFLIYLLPGMFRIPSLKKMSIGI